MGREVQNKRRNTSTINDTVNEICVNDKSVLCDHCIYRCKTKQELKSHKIVHRNEKLFQCTKCDYSCKNKKDLKRHILVHSDYKPISCTLCEYRCRTNKDLKSHMFVHTKEKSYSCSECDYKCGKARELRRHMRTHTNERPFICIKEGCSYAGAMKYPLWLHICNGYSISIGNISKQKLFNIVFFFSVHFYGVRDHQFNGYFY